MRTEAAAAMSTKERLVKVHLDLEKCQGYICCVVAAPEVFDIDDDSGLAVLKESHPGEELRARVEQAVRECPTNAITMEET